VPRYRKSDPRFWKDEKILSFDPTDKLLAQYAFTGQSNRIGCFAFSPGMAAEDTGVPLRTFVKRFRQVCQRLNWKWDERVGVLYLPTWWKYNQPENANNVIGNLKDLDDVPDSPLMDEFCGKRHLPPPQASRDIQTNIGATFRGTSPQTFGISGAGAEAGTGNYVPG